MTQGVGRNEACPCGSGRKYKKCCLDQRPSAAFTPAHRQAALDKLAEFSSRPSLDEERMVAGLAFWSGWLDSQGEEAGRPAMDFAESITAFGSWFALDFRLAGGTTVVELMLRREGARLAPGEREYLHRLHDTHLQPYQVTDVRPDEGLRLIDLWTGEQVWVRERLATSRLVRWDFLVVRLMRGADGDLVIEGMPYLYPVATKNVLLRAMRRAHRDFKRRTLFGGSGDFFKEVGMAFHHFWLETVAVREPPSLVTAEGDPLIFARAVFEVCNRPRVEAALSRHPDLDRDDDGGYTWLEDAPEFRRGLGRFVLDEERLVFETQSEKRVERGRQFLASLVGEAVQFRLVELEGPERAMERLGSSAERPAADAVPPAIEAQVVGEYYEKHYQAWLDEPIPALGNRTPREAARLKRVRPKLVGLLQEFENMSARERLEGRPAYDFDWMWAELGLTRP
jgi:hypothetical protein